MALRDVTQGLCYAGKRELVLELIEGIASGEIRKMSSLAKKVPSEFRRASPALLGHRTTEDVPESRLEYSAL
jgi:hypothetical protein